MKISKNSIKYRLLISLSSLITLCLLVIGGTSFFITKYESSEVFNASLLRTAKLLLSLTKHEIIEHELDENFVINLGLADDVEFHRYENKIHFQIWKREKLIYDSSSDIVKEKPDNIGFADIEIDNVQWKSFTIYDPKSAVTIEVLENKQVRRGLIAKILLSILLPLLASFVPLIIIIYFIVNKNLLKLTDLSDQIKNISPLKLKPFKGCKNLPSEIRPLIDSLNFFMIKLEESMNNEKRFINYASHELRTPLAVIKTKTQFLLKKYKSNNELVDDLDNLLQAVDRIISLSSQLLSLSRIDIEDRDIEKQPVNLKNLIIKIINNHIFKAQEKGVEIEFNTEEPELFVSTNIFHLEVMISNIVDNAIKYSPANQKVIINLNKKGEQIILLVKNKGNLILPEDQNKIFEQFFRVTHDDYNKGSGLGLSIVKKIAELNNFKIKLTSKDGFNEFEIIFGSAPLFRVNYRVS